MSLRYFFSILWLCIHSSPKGIAFQVLSQRIALKDRGHADNLIKNVLRIRHILCFMSNFNLVVLVFNRSD